LSENNSLRKTVEKFQAQSAVSARKELESSAVKVGSIRLMTGIIEADSADTLKNIAHQIRNSGDDIVLVIGAETAGKASLLVMVSDKIVNEKKISAVSIIKEISPNIEGGGGGQPFLATAGGKKPSGLKAAIEAAEKIVGKF
jgi:alanyl-tRNA synthetase